MKFILNFTPIAKKVLENLKKNSGIGGMRGLICSLTFATKGGQNVRVLY